MTDLATTEQRTETVVSALMDAIRNVILEHKVTYPEYDAAKQYAIELGEAGEWPLFADVFFEAAVEQVESDTNDASDGTIEGPYFIPGAQMLERPYVMPMRDDEPGERLVFSGRVLTAGGEPLGGAQIDMWQSDNEGTYSDIPYADDRELPPSGNLRARFAADEDGRFEVRTIRPVPYEIPKSGPTGALLRAAGWHAFRPAHLHVIASAPGRKALTAQLYFSDDPYLDSDVAGAVKPSLVLDVTQDGDALRASHEFRLAEDA